MLKRTSAYDQAVTGSDRVIFLQVIVDISDPDKVFLPVTGSPQAPWSKAEELCDKIFDSPARYQTLEPGRTLLNGEFDLFPDDYRVPEQMGFCTKACSGPDAVFPEPQQIQANYANMSILQAFSLYFSEDPADGVPEDFTVEVVQGGTAYFSQTITGNRETRLQFAGFSVHNPDAVRVTVTRWSLPGRHLRAVEIVPGIYEVWDEGKIKEFFVQQKGDFSCLTVPAGTADIGIDNKDRRFDPRVPDNVFDSIQERQGIEIRIGVLLPDGAREYKGVGVYYQAKDGWKSSSNDMYIKWTLLDIVGLLADWAFLPPEVLPTTQEGWLRAIVSQLGPSFANRYQVDPNYANLPVTAKDRAAVTDRTCGEILKWVCQAAGTWPRSDSETGKLTAEPLWNQGAKLDLDNLRSYADMQTNQQISALIFVLSDGTKYVVSGNTARGGEPITVKNPFIHTKEQALTAARLILAQYGGWTYQIDGRGSPASEIGDVDTIWLDESNAVTARRMSQAFRVENYALVCESKLLQADGSYLWTEFALITASGRWKAPAGVSRLRVAIGQAGQGGGRGQDGQQRPAGSSNISFSGYNMSYGEAGANGSGGMVWYGVFSINPEQEFDVRIGEGGAPGAVFGEAGEEGGHTTFGPYSSADGELYPDGYTDITTGQAFARSGVEAPLAGTGDGGRGGAGGDPGQGHVEWVEHSFQPAPSDPDRPGTLITGHNTWVQTKPPGPGQPGAKGGGGFVLIMWEKPEEEISHD